MKKNEYFIEVSLYWREVFKLINGIGDLKKHQAYSNRAWITSYRKDGAAIWNLENCDVILISDGENSVISLKIKDDKLADIESLNTWGKIESSLLQYVTICTPKENKIQKKLSENRLKEIREIDKLDLKGWQKADRMNVARETWQRLKRAADLTRPYRKNLAK